MPSRIRPDCFLHRYAAYMSHRIFHRSSAAYLQLGKIPNLRPSVHNLPNPALQLPHLELQYHLQPHSSAAASKPHTSPPSTTKGTTAQTTTMAGPIKVAVLDDYQNLHKGPFSTLPKSTFSITSHPDTLLPYNHPSTPKETQSALVARLAPYEVICAMRERTPLPSALIAQLPNLKLVLTTGMRNKGLDLPALRAANIAVHGAPDRLRAVDSPGPDSTTQHCIALLLALVRFVAQDDANVKRGLWQENVAFGLAGKTLGCVGFGRLGVAVARIMVLAFGMKVVAWSSSLTQEACDEKCREAGLPVSSVRCVGKEELFRTADVVSVHYVLSERSRGIVGEAELAQMGKNSFLLNSSRGPLIDEKALLKCLKAGAIRAVALDVHELEPLPLDSEWRTTRWGVDGRSDVLLSPHMGYVEEGTMRDWYEQTAEQLLRYAEGQELQNSML